jgi:hypothetical protein
MNLWDGPNRDLGGASHLHLLLACVAATSGPVLEIGIGHTSTPCLHSVCCAAQRPLVSLESDPDWLAQFSEWDRDGHVLGVDDQSAIAEARRGYQGQRWSVVFIDDSPGAEARAEQLNWFLPIADYVVMHDCEPEGNNHWPARRVLNESNCQHVLWYSRYHPWTLAASLYHPIPLVP